jgi:hypothetical protein
MAAGPDGEVGSSDIVTMADATAWLDESTTVPEIVAAAPWKLESPTASVITGRRCFLSRITFPSF